MKPAILFALALPLFGADALPSWIRETLQQTLPSYPPKVTRVVMLQEEHLTVAPDGRRVIRERGALRLLQKDRSAVQAMRAYNTKSGRIRDFQGWFVGPDGRTSHLNTKDHVLDVALSQRFTYDEARMKVMEFPRDALPDSVFAWEIIEEEKTIFSQYSYAFQSNDPVLISRFALTAPPGWEVRGTMMNAADLKPQVSGATTTWELLNLPWIPDEEYRPDTHALAPRLGLSYFPDSSAHSDLKPLSSWQAVSLWLSSLVDPQSEVSLPIREKAAILSTAAKTPVERMQAIAEFAQQTNYVSVQMNLTRAGGYIPNKADAVLARNYGDCKDKANLMRALLKAQGIDSFLTVLYSGDRDYVQSAWPSPFQFNHAILAIRIPADIRFPAMVDHAKLGRLLFFDPTDPVTPFGDLPEDLQGSKVLVLAGGSGELLQLPLLPPERNHVASTVTGQLALSGGLQATLVRSYSGQAAAAIRANFNNDEKNIKRMFERSFSQRLGAVSVNSIAVHPKAGKTEIEATVDITVNQFAQVMQERIVIVAPGSIVPRSDYLLAEESRTLPLKLQGRSSRNVVRLQIPAGFQADEIPSPLAVEREYGHYAASWTVDKGEIVFEQTVLFKDLTVPAADYRKVKSFFDEFAGAQDSAVVLIRTASPN